MKDRLACIEIPPHMVMDRRHVQLKKCQRLYKCKWIKDLPLKGVLWIGSHFKGSIDKNKCELTVLYGEVPHLLETWILELL